ncbi:MAG: P-type conjugative transfer protein TrbL [Halieaceae bacterium]|nr:P-type conjugative transfer protein TrbL [Halieaceae bacterium]
MNSLGVSSARICLLFALCCFSALANAQTKDEFDLKNNVAANVQRRFEAATVKVAEPLRNYAENFFWILAALDFVWFCILMALRQPDFPEFIGGVVRRVLTIGFFWTLLLFSESWLNAIVNSFKQLALLSVSEAATLSPADVFDSGLKLLGQVLAAEAGLLDASALALVALVMFLLLAGVAALVLLAVIELHFVLALGVIVMALAATQWTWVWAANVYKYAITAGMKLFILHLLITAGLGIMESMLSAVELTFMDAAALAGVSLILLILARSLPRSFEALTAGGFVPVGQGQTGASLPAQSMLMMGMGAALAMGRQAGAPASAGGRETHPPPGADGQNQSTGGGLGRSMGGEFGAGAGPRGKNRLGEAVGFTGSALKNIARAGR